MKAAWAIICSLVLAGTPFLPAQTLAPACAKQPVRACCQHGVEMPCCAAKPASGSQPAPVIPAQSVSQNQIALPAPGVVAWTLPESPANLFSSAAVPLTAASPPLYARNCALLL